MLAWLAGQSIPVIGVVAFAWSYLFMVYDRPFGGGGISVSPAALENVVPR